jgi:hypothetical protein
MNGCTEFRTVEPRISRRRTLEIGSLGAFGLALPELLALRSAGASEGSHGAGFGRAKACILMFMWGGPSHLDTWDLKPHAPNEIRGEFKAVSTNVSGIEISEHFPQLARHADKYSIVRSVSHGDPAHLSSVHHFMTGRPAVQVNSDAISPSRKDSPHVGSVLARLRPSQNPLPPFVMLPWYVYHPSALGGTAPGQHAGWMGAAYDPLLITDDPNAPDFRISGLSLIDGVSRGRIDARRELLQTVGGVRAPISGTAGESFAQMQEHAFDMLTSAAVPRAFQLDTEPAEVRERYGRHIHGQSLLLARRLVEAGVSLVCVNWHNDHKSFWDTHGNNFKRLKNDLMPPADRGFAALLEDLSERGLLDETLLVWVGEFGRKPQITPGNAGREHWPWCGSAVFAGGGIRGGTTFGRSDSQGGYPAENPVSPADVAATMYHALGIPADLLLHDRENRPVRVTEGEPIGALFA